MLSIRLNKLQKAQLDAASWTQLNETVAQGNWKAKNPSGRWSTLCSIFQLYACNADKTLLHSHFWRKRYKSVGVHFFFTLLFQGHATTLWLPSSDLHATLLSHSGPLENIKANENLQRFQSCPKSEKPALSRGKLPRAKWNRSVLPA